MSTTATALPVRSSRRRVADGEASALLEIIGQLERLDVDDDARTAFRSLIVAFGTQHGFRSIERREQMAFVRHLLALKVSRPTIRDRIMARYGISTRQAYRLIGEAL